MRDFNQDWLDGGGHIAEGRKHVIHEIGIHDLPVVKDYLFEKGLAHPGDGGALELLPTTQRVDRLAHVNCRDVLHEPELSRLAIDLHLGRPRPQEPKRRSGLDAPLMGHLGLHLALSHQGASLHPETFEENLLVVKHGLEELNPAVGEFDLVRRDAVVLDYDLTTSSSRSTFHMGKAVQLA